MKLNLGMTMKILKKCSTKSKYHDDSKKLVIGKIKDKTAGVAIEECHIKAKYVFIFRRQK